MRTLPVEPMGQPRDPSRPWEAGIVQAMSAADGWDLTVPEDEAEFLAELRRHGVRPGQRLHVAPARDDEAQDLSETKDRRTVRRLSFAGSVHAEPDLSERTDEYLSGFGLT